MKGRLRQLLACVLTFTMLSSSAAVLAEEVSDIPEVRIKGELSVNTAEKTILYVATDGDDTNNGTIDKPFATIEKARDTLREMKNEGTLAKGGAVVYIRGGEYFLEKAIKFSEEDSGTVDAPIVYRNYPDEVVQFIGGAYIKADNFEKITDEDVLSKIVNKDARKKIVGVNLFELGYKSIPEQTWPGAYSYYWSISEISGKSAPEAVASELIINDKAMTIARYPNNDYMYIDAVLNPGENVRMWEDDKVSDPNYIPPEKRKTTPFEITVRDDRVKYWTEAKDALLTGCFKYAWADQTVPLASVDVTLKSLKSKIPSLYQVASGMFFYINNLVEEIDMPGEYFIDRDSGMLYLYPPEEEFDKAVYTILEDRMFEFNKSEYITLKGFEMLYMRNGTIRLNDTVGCEIVGCKIMYTGKTAVYVSGRDNKVYDCYIADVNEGIYITGGDPATLTHANNIIENNEIERADRINKTYSSAISMKGTGNYAMHNEIHDADHAIAGIDGVENTYAYNEFYDACKHADDMGALYGGRTLTAKGNRIIHNYFHNIGGEKIGALGTHAIFLDDWWSSALMEGNVFENITGAAVKFAGSHNKLVNNLFINVTGDSAEITRSYAYGSADSEVTFRNDIAAKPYIYSELWLSRYPEMANVIDSENKLDMNNNIVAKNNILYKSGSVKTSNEVYKTATLENNIKFNTDPGFYSIEDRNYLLKPDSKIYEQIPDFKPILFTRMGRYSERALNRVKDAYVFCNESPFVIEKGEKVRKNKNALLEIDGANYITLRDGADVFGATVEFNEETNEVIVSSGAKVLSFVSNGSIDNVKVNGESHLLSESIVNFEDTNYISVDDLTEIFDGYITHKGNLWIISTFDGLFTDGLDDGLLRYIEAQVSIF